MNNSNTSQTNDADFGIVPDDSSLKLTHAVYALQVMGLFIPILYIVSVIINHVKVDDLRNTWLASHFRWQMRTFWFSLPWLVIGWVTIMIFGIGLLILIPIAIWVIYRIIKGWLRLSEKKSMYV